MPRIAVVPGDGIGTEVIEQGVAVLKALASDIEFEHFDLGAERYLRDGEWGKYGEELERLKETLRSLQEASP